MSDPPRLLVVMYIPSSCMCATGKSQWASIFSLLESEVGSSAKQSAGKGKRAAPEEEATAASSKRPRLLSDSRLVTRLTDTAHKVSNAAAGMDEAGGGTDEGVAGASSSDSKKTTAGSSRSSRPSSAGELYLAERRPISSPPLPGSFSTSSKLPEGPSSFTSSLSGRWVMLSGVKMGAIFVHDC
jgi:hypothetical protein